MGSTSSLFVTPERSPVQLRARKYLKHLLSWPLMLETFCALTANCVILVTLISALYLEFFELFCLDVDASLQNDQLQSLCKQPDLKLVSLFSLVTCHSWKSVTCRQNDDHSSSNSVESIASQIPLMLVRTGPLICFPERIA